MKSHGPARLPAILVVDDEVRSLEALRRTLEEDFKVLCAGSAEEALELMQRETPAGGVQVVVCDQPMPGMTSDAAGIAPTPNGRLAQQLTLATENLADHLTHFYLFFMPDFARPAYAGQPWFGTVGERFVATRGSAAAEVLPARANLLKLMGFLAGKWPHTLALQPGGSSHSVSAAERVRLQALLRQFRSFLEKTLFGDHLEAVAALASEEVLRAWATGRKSDFALFLAAAYELKLEATGRSTELFLSYGAYDRFASGLRRPGQPVTPLDAALVTEDHHSAWLRDDGPLPPASGRTQIEPDKPGAYTWCKAPRYGGEVAEVGALARQFIDGHPLAEDYVGRHGGSLIARVVARLLEIARVVPLLEAWMREIAPGEPFCNPCPLPEKAGRGLGGSRPRQPGPLARNPWRPHRALPDRRPDHLELLPARRRRPPWPDESGPTRPAEACPPVGPNSFGRIA